MPVLDYATRVPTSRCWISVILAILVGSICGAVAGDHLYQPVLGLLIKNGVKQFQVNNVNEPFLFQMQFSGVTALGGALVGCCAVAVRYCVKLNWLFGMAIALFAFLLGCAGGWIYLRIMWNPPLVTEAMALRRGLPVLQSHINLASVPALILPFTGCAVVLLFIGALFARHLIIIRSMAGGRKIDHSPSTAAGESQRGE